MNVHNSEYATLYKNVMLKCVKNVIFPVTIYLQHNGSYSLRSRSYHNLHSYGRTRWQ